MPATLHPVYTYWSDKDLALHQDLIAHWRSEFPHFTIYGDSDVRSLLAQYFPDKLEVYDEIRIPTAKSDIALLILLYHLGGLYIDCHCGITDINGVRTLLASLFEFDAVFVNKALSEHPRPLDECLALNSIIFARRRFELFRKICGQALVNLSRQRVRERAKGFTPYDIWMLSGPWLVTSMLMEPGSFNQDVRAESEGRVMFIREEIAPIKRNCFRGYSSASAHWSVRQESECLFLPPMDKPSTQSFGDTDEPPWPRSFIDRGAVTSE